MNILPIKSVQKRLYVCGDFRMLLTMDLAWGFYEKYREKLEPFNSAYTKEYGEEQAKAIGNAKRSGSIYAMREPSIIIRGRVSTAGKSCTRNFKALKRYIFHLGYDGAILQQHYRKAGQLYFAKAANQNWEQMEKMNACVLHYLDENRLKLKQQGNMPSCFINKVTEGAALFEKLLRSFEKESVITDMVGDKITANNTIFKIGMAMLMDAQVALAGTVIANIFSYNRLLRSIHRKRKRTTGVVKTADNIGVAYATIIVELDGEEIKTIRANKKGEFKTCRISGDVKLRIVAKGLVTEIMEETLGEVNKHLDIVMRAA